MRYHASGFICLYLISFLPALGAPQVTFHGQPSGAGNNSPGSSVNWRARGLDAIVFQNSLEFNLEIWHWANTAMDYSVTNQWYAFPGTDWRFEGEEHGWESRQ
jgi:hypothetical protein